MKESTRKRINTIIGLGALIFASTLLYNKIRSIRLEELIDYLCALGRGRIFLILLLITTDYLVLTRYDWLALRFLKRRISYPRIALATVVSYSLSKNLGISWLTGGSLRYRFYSRCGMRLLDVSKVVLLGTTTFASGFFFLGGLSLFLFPSEGELISSLPQITIRLVGMGFLGVVMLYLLICSWRCKEISFRGRKWTLPPFPVASLQLLLGSLDVFLMVWILYLFLPFGPLSLASFIGVYFMGQWLAILSHSPGGLGVFETAMLALLKDIFPEPILLSSLLLYRVAYFLLPLTIGIILLAVDELRERNWAPSPPRLQHKKKTR